MTRGDVHVRWRGLYGNRLFQLAAGLVLAIESGARLRSKELPGFPLVDFKPPADEPHMFRTSSQQPSFDRSDLVRRLQSGEHIVVDGHHQQYGHYRDHKAAIRTLLRFQAGCLFVPEPADLVVHLRLGGQWLQWPYDLNGLWHQVEAWRTGRVVIVTDEPLHPFVRSRECYRDTVVVSMPLLSDFHTLLRARRLVLTPSTFGWWAAFLGRADEVFFPYRQGIWRKDYIDLFVDDEPRYIKY